MTALHAVAVDRSSLISDYLDRIYGDLMGWAMVGHGEEPYLAGPGKVKHRRFREQPFNWPAQRDELIAHILDNSTDHDVWVTPGLSNNPVRNMERRRSLSSRWLWVDCDGLADHDRGKLSQVAAAGSFVVRSGRGRGHVHLYVALDDDTDPDTVADLNRRLVAHLHGDGSPSALNGYLRPVGSFNHKPTVLTPGSEPALVTIAKDTEGAGWSVSDLDDLLPLAEQKHDTGGHDLPAPVALPADLPAIVVSILEDRADENLDRSERLMALVVACRREGLSEGQIMAIGRQHRPSVAKYGRRVDEHIWRCLFKTRPQVNDTPDASASSEDPNEQIGASWAPRDLTDIIAGLQAGTITRPEPTVGCRDDGECLFYPGRVNAVQGESGGGKSWLVLHVAAQEIAQGHHVAYIDLEDDETGTCGRLLDLGVEPRAILERFHYVHPDEPYGIAASEHLLELVASVAPTLVVIDSTGEALSLNGVKDVDDEVARWFRLLPKPIARRGPAVVTVDHVTKAKDGRGLYAIGSQRKRAAITGASYMVEPIKAMGKGAAGAAKLITAKDRCGTHKTGSTAAMFNLDATGWPTVAGLTAPADITGGGGGFEPTCLMEKVSRYLEIHPRSSKGDVDNAKLGKAEYVRDAMRILVERDHVTVEKDGHALRCTVQRPYRETPENDLLEDS